MKRLLTTLIFMVSITYMKAQSVQLYNPKDNAEKQIKEAVEKAKNSGKHVLIQVGGNWCVWCIRFDQYVKNDPQLDSVIQKNYIVYHLNWSPENKNEAMLESLGFPQRFGFPVFVILDDNGKRLHTQDSGLLEEGESYNKNVVMNFLNNWTKEALKPENNKY